jgi:exodeoxyribonuclease-3
MRKFIKKLKKSNKNIIITGDFNCANEDIDVYDPINKDKVPGFTPHERLNFKRLLNLGFIDTFRYLNPGRVYY